TYNLVVQLGNLRSLPVPFILADASAPGMPPAGGIAPQPQLPPQALPPVQPGN
ncbi:MAG TPA: hypothetical protein VMS16_05685, partial [Mycobacterium sp.]|nr:hypothetical protein [Mycobacterium sp.]